MLSTRLILIASLAIARCLAIEVYYDVACPGTNTELYCPPGQEIELLSLHHGLNSTIDCAEKNQQVEVSTDKCFHDEMLGWAKFICDKMEHCRLPKPHPDMFQCDNAEEFFVQATYICRDKEADSKIIEVCEGDTANLECETGFINIVKASYGRFDMHTCTETPSTMTFCASYGADYKIQDMCDDYAFCYFPVESYYLGIPHNCDHLRKYLRVEYFCE